MCSREGGEQRIIGVKQFGLNLGSQNIDLIPAVGTVIVNQPRLFLRNIAQTSVIEAIEQRIVVDILEVDLEQFERKRSITLLPNPAFLLNNQGVHGPPRVFL
jgi:hypothetical protein